MRTIQDTRQIDIFSKPGTWVAPTNLPDWRNEDIIAIDTETRDKGINEGRGAGWAFQNAGHIAGISMASSRGSVYVPIRHPESSNFDIERVKVWIRAHAHVPTVFHNASYDLGWLKTDLNIDPPHIVHDTMMAAPLIDENRTEYNLDACCRWMGIAGKDELALREAATARGFDPKRDIWQMDAASVGNYAEQDARATLHLWHKLSLILDKQNLWEAYQLEIDLLPLTMRMRRQGVPIDLDRCDEARTKLLGLRDEHLNEVRKLVGQPRKVTIDEIHSVKWLMMAFDEQGLKYPRTPKLKLGQFKAEWLEEQSHPLPRLIVKIRGLHDAGDKFINNYIKGFSEAGRIHAELHQLRSDFGGTRTYRFSYSNPPLQQMPARDDDIAPIIRGCFLPEQGEEWASLDFKSQEPRMTVHWAAKYNCSGANNAVNYYRTHANPDPHQYVSDLMGVTRKQAKPINLGLAYGMGLDKLCASLGVDLIEGIRLLNLYHKSVPYMKQLTYILGREAETRGYITLIDGARCRFDLWEPVERFSGTGNWVAKSLDKAQAQWRNQPLKRAGAHKAMNKMIQGSSARQTKLVMRQLYRNKIYPSIMMHDELTFSGNGDRWTKPIADIMCNTVSLLVPTAVDIAIGKSWGDAM